MTIRPARLADAEAIRAIYNDAVATTTATMDTEPRTAEAQAQWMARHNGDPYPALVAETGGVVRGWASLSPYHPRAGYATTAEISIYVAADARGQGVGAALLEGLLAEAHKRPFVTLVALVTADNAASLRLHARFDFVTAGTLTRIGRKFDRWIDVTFLQKTIH